VGSEIYRGLATVIVGGMVTSALFTLILLPALLRVALPAWPGFLRFHWLPLTRES
jgi:Cu/Ag efflux pump CusA